MGKQCCLDNWKTQYCMLKLLFAVSSEHITAWTQAYNINKTHCVHLDVYCTGSQKQWND